MKKDKLIEYLRKISQTHDGMVVDLNGGAQHEKDWAWIEDICTESADMLQSSEPVRHAHWMRTFDKKAGVCARCYHVDMNAFRFSGRYLHKYCPYCGAKMDEEAEE